MRVVNLVHPWNALLPIEVSEAGSVTEVNLVQLEKAPLPKEVIL